MTTPQLRSDRDMTPMALPADADALFDLGVRHAAGCDGEPDLVAAHKWFNLAALKGRMDAMALRREVAELMSDVEIALAQRAARAWITAH